MCIIPSNSSCGQWLHSFYQFYDEKYVLKYLIKKIRKPFSRSRSRSHLISDTTRRRAVQRFANLSQAMMYTVVEENHAWFIVVYASDDVSVSVSCAVNLVTRDAFCRRVLTTTATWPVHYFYCSIKSLPSINVI